MKDLGPHLGECFGVPGLKPIGQFKPKNPRVLVDFPELLYKGHRRGGLWEAGKGCWGSHIRDLPLLVTQQLLIRQADTHGRARISSRTPQGYLS